MKPALQTKPMKPKRENHLKKEIKEESSNLQIRKTNDNIIKLTNKEKQWLKELLKAIIDCNNTWCEFEVMEIDYINSLKIIKKL